jgi:hypothetical protein
MKTAPIRLAVVAAPVVMLASVAGAQTSTATYLLTFNATWSQQTHPVDWPPTAHWSQLVGGTHDETVRFWEPGGIASQGIEDMAELGAKYPLLDEVGAAIDAGSARSRVTGGNISPSPGAAEATVVVDTEYPLVTVVTMVAPSPDWFVGVSGLNLRGPDGWLSEVTVEMYPWDAGSDAGTTFQSPNDDITPQAPISSLQGTFPFEGTPAMGAFTFTLQSVACGYADFTRDNALDVFDYLAFVNAFNTGAPEADCNRDETLDLFDFLCFVNTFSAGCG